MVDMYIVKKRLVKLPKVLAKKWWMYSGVYVTVCGGKIVISPRGEGIYMQFKKSEKRIGDRVYRYLYIIPKALELPEDELIPARYDADRDVLEIDLALLRKMRTRTDM